jgi:lysophospholipase L1-like esterase
MKVIALVMKKSLPVIAAGLAILVVSAWMLAPEKCSGPFSKSSAELGSYGFIQYEQNKIQLQPQGVKWNNLFSKFEQLAFNGTGKISIVHIGGSHVQGGFLSDKLRKNFQDMVYGAEGERGFVFPYELAKTNSPRSIKCNWTGKWAGCRNALSTDDCDWGMSGINATTTDRNAHVTIKTFNFDSLACKFDKVRIYHACSENVTISLDSALVPISVEEQKDAGYTEYVFAQMHDELGFGIHCTDSLACFFALQGVYLGNNADGISYHAIGVNGASTRSYLRCDKMDEQMATLHPDLVIFGIGVNDANVPSADFDPALYEARYDSLVAMIQAINPDACFLFVTNNDTYYQKSYPNPNALKVRDTMVRLAAKYDGAVYDLFEIMGGLGSISKWQNANLAAKDKIHLSKRGYELQADMMSEAFREAFGNYLDKRQ